MSYEQQQQQQIQQQQQQIQQQQIQQQPQQIQVTHSIQSDPQPPTRKPRQTSHIVTSIIASIISFVQFIKK